MSVSDMINQPDSLEFAGNMLDRHDMHDVSMPSLLEITGISQHMMPTASGLNDYDYQNLSSLSMGLKTLNQLATVNKVPIPPEIMEHFKHIKCHCMMGLFSEIGRAWLTIDSDIYIWTYENSRDVAYFDGLNHLIVSVGLVPPKPGVFISDVKYLLIITTPIEIVVLGVTFGDSTKTIQSPSRSALQNGNQYEEMQLMNKPIFILNTDNVAMTCIEGTIDGRIFMGGRDGCLYEIVYQAESNWFGKRSKKINHSQSIMSYIVPGFLKVFSDTDSISKLTIDNCRKLLYVLTEKGAIEAWDIGSDYNSMRRLARLSQNDISNYAANVLKTVDVSVFKPVTAICALLESDCPNLHLLAVTQKGVRFYFSTIQILQNYQTQTIATTAVESNRPNGLYMLHVRLPPGYTPNASIGKPKDVHAAFYSQGTLLIVSSPQQEQDLVWSLSSEPFPMRQYLAESSTFMPLDGQVWAIAEVKQKNIGTLVNNPIINARTPKKVVMLTNQGAHIVSLLKPIDLLKQLLISCQGPHHEAVKAYFQVQSEPQACATSILLACMESLRGTEMTMWATQAFLLYGGEPYFGGNYLNNQSAIMNASTTFIDPLHSNPRVFMSTPFTRPATSVQQSLMQQTQFPTGSMQNINPNFNNSQTETNINYSAKHAGLYLHISRLLRPIWKKRCVDAKMYSLITQQDCSNILDDLYSLKQFLDNNIAGIIQKYTSHGHNNNQTTYNNATPIGGHNLNYQSDLVRHQHQKNTPEEAHAEEKKSLDSLNRFIRHVCEVMALWKILCEHQLHMIVQTLPKEHQHILGACTFRDLILSRLDTCALLIDSLISTYLIDNASVGSISSKLRDVCPTLYRHEDAISHKATEILMMSKICTDADEKQEKLSTALKLCKDAAPFLPLSNICQQFTASNFYQGVIELCVECGKKIDPNESGLHYYRNNEPIEDQEGYLCYTARRDCYKEIKYMLEQVYQSLSNGNNAMQNSNIETNHCGFVIQDNEKNINTQILKIVQLVLQTNDQLLHISVYEWLLSHQLLSELLGITEPSLGKFLGRSVANTPENLALADLLWKYYERNGQHAAAAKILDNLASMESDSILLKQRIEYLARAVMCMRSDTIGYSSHNGVLSKDLEDKLEIARIQKLILDKIESLSIDSQQNTQIKRHLITQLNNKLYNITELYTEFTENNLINLWECKLTILNCSHHNDPLLIESVWINIIDNELKNENANFLSPFEKSIRLLTKVQSLSLEYGNSGHCFPLAFLVRELEIRCCHLKLEQSPVPDKLVEMDLDIELLLDIYSRMISMNERIWSTEGNEWHLVQSSSRLVSILAAQSNQLSMRNRRRVLAKAQDLISACLNQLYTKPETKPLIDCLREVQIKLQRFSS